MTKEKFAHVCLADDVFDCVWLCVHLLICQFWQERNLLTFVWPTRYLTACHKKKIPCPILCICICICIWLRATRRRFHAQPCVVNFISSMSIFLRWVTLFIWHLHKNFCSVQFLKTDQWLYSQQHLWQCDIFSFFCLFLSRRAARRWESMSARRWRLATWEKIWYF